MDNSLTKSDLIESLAQSQNHLPLRDVELAVKSLLEKMSHELASGERIEVRGFGSFSLHFRPARMGRNPKSGDAVALSGKYVPHFKPGKELRERVNFVNTEPSRVGESRRKRDAERSHRDLQATSSKAAATHSGSDIGKSQDPSTAVPPSNDGFSSSGD